MTTWMWADPEDMLRMSEGATSKGWPVPPLDDMMEVDTRWGRMPLWKCRAMCIAYTQTAIADSLDNNSGTLRDEDKPPPLAADDRRIVHVGFPFASDQACRPASPCGALACVPPTEGG
jgi:hypothetical protein